MDGLVYDTDIYHSCKYTNTFYYLNGQPNLFACNIYIYIYMYAFV